MKKFAIPMLFFFLASSFQQAEAINIASSALPNPWLDRAIPSSWKTLAAPDNLWSIHYPPDWEAISRDELTALNIPEDAVGALKMSHPVTITTPVLIITKEKLTKPSTSQQYSRASVRSVTQLENYHLITRSLLGNGPEILHVFSAGSGYGTTNYFYQVSTVSGQEGLSFTITSGNVRPSGKLESTIRKMLLSIQLSPIPSKD